MKITSTRSSIVWVFIIVAALCFASVVGWYVWNQNNNSTAPKINTPDQNAQIEKQAINERNHSKCEEIKGDTATADPTNLPEPTMIPEKDAKYRCHTLIDWWSERDKQDNSNQ